MNITLASTGPQLFPAKRRYQKTAVRRSVCWFSRALVLLQPIITLVIEKIVLKRRHPLCPFMSAVKKGLFTK